VKTNSCVHTAKWIFDVGESGGGNNELEYYTTSTMDGAGNLLITAIKETLSPKCCCPKGRCQ
jgi:hypothetical protein